MSVLLKEQVLVLNKSWSFVNFRPLNNILPLLFGKYKNGESKANIIECIGGKFFVVDNNKKILIDSAKFSSYTWDDWSKMRPNDGEAFIPTTRGNLRIPKVVRLTRFDKVYLKDIVFNRKMLYRRDRNQCQYCGDKPGTELLSIDHVIPRSKGGATSWNNCVLACVKCNTKKANRTPEQAGMNLISHPEKPKSALMQDVPEVIEPYWEDFISAAYWNVKLK